MLHFWGVNVALVLLLATLLTGRWWLLTLVPVCGYGLAWIGHWTAERNQPATFGNPLWSLAANFRMWRLMLTQKMPAEIARIEHQAGT
jgi:hypothetical protein